MQVSFEDLYYVGFTFFRATAATIGSLPRSRGMLRLHTFSIGPIELISLLMWDFLQSRLTFPMKTTFFSSSFVSSGSFSVCFKGFEGLSRFFRSSSGVFGGSS